MKSTSLLSWLIFLPLFASAQSEMASQSCHKTDSKQEMDACFSSPGLKWTVKAPENLTPEKMIAGPKISPALSASEQKERTVFCQYFQHNFTNSGSAKFLCGRTLPDGTLLNEDGEPVPEARDISTRAMKLVVTLNGKTEEVGESVLLDNKGQPIVRRNEEGVEKLVKADELKIKYFVDANQYKDSNVQRRNETISFDGQQLDLRNVFIAPTEITNNRWNEVFTEVASTRLFWALGLPADVMVPVNKIVCFGCLSHPMEQKNPDMQKTSIFNFPVIEKKFKGKKIGEHFALNRIIKYNMPQWNEEMKTDFESLVLGARLIGYFSTQNVQNRLHCDKKEYDSATQVCSGPIPLIQDLGSTWAAKVGVMTRLQYKANPRGVLSIYKSDKAFSDPRTCSLAIEFGLDGDKDGSTVKRVSRAGLEKFKKRLEALTPEVMRALFEVARFGDMDPGLRDSMKGDIDSRRAAVISMWTKALSDRIEEIKQASCQ